MRAGQVLVECKTTSRKSFAVTRELIEKLEREALATGRVLDELEGDMRGGAEGSTCPKEVT